MATWPNSRGAFCTPVNYFHPQVKERAAQFFYMWDETAFYAGLRTLDKKQANFAPDDRLWEGDGVEWYFDTRRDENFRGLTWGKGAVHMYWTGYKETNLAPRWCSAARLSRCHRRHRCASCRTKDRFRRRGRIQAAVGEFSRLQGRSG